MIKLDNSGLKRLNSFYRRTAFQMKKASIGLVNNTAFRLRNDIVEEIEDSMTVRAPRFISGSIRRTKANFRTKTAEVGSISRPRFSGWVEQQKGTPSKRKRQPTLTARTGGNWKKKTAPRFRFKPAKRFVRPSTDPFRKKGRRLSNNSGRDIAIFLQILRRNKYRQPFFLPIKYKRLEKGLYIFKKKRLQLVQGLDPDPTKRNTWMTRVVKNLTAADIHADWNKSLRFFGLK